MDKKQSRNPYNLCIFNPVFECSGCPLKEKLDCHFSWRKLIRFASAFFFIIVAGSAGLIYYGFMREFYGFLVLLGVFSIIFFEFWEIRILCSHCPFYSEEGKTLHCCANFGSLKVWKYHPGPMSKSEKVQLIIGFLMLVAILLVPPAILVLHAYYLFAAPTVLGLAIFGYVLRRYHCSTCINFSCPLNTMPKNIIDEFLKRNPVMKKAWAKD